MAPHILVADPSRVALESVYEFFVGDGIGKGIHRSVYELRHDTTKVVKICVGCVDQNVLEWHVWHRMKDTAYAKWFAPLEACSEDGRVLIQHRATPMRPSEYPQKVPAFFTDLKPDNWGMLNGRAVCTDYGYTRLMDTGMTKRMINAVWD